MGLLLGIDAGTTSLKVAVFADDGSPLAVAREEYRLQTPGPDRVELDPMTYWRALVGAVRQALGAAAVDGGDVSAVAVSSQGETVIPVGADGTPRGPALVWLDNRAAAEADELAGRFDISDVYAATGIPAINPTWTASKLLWWKRHEPTLYDSSRFLLVEDFLLHRLTGRFVSDGGVRCTTLLYDIRSHGWWPPMLEFLELSAERLPELETPGSIVGTLRAAAAAELGLSPSARVVAGGMDQGAGAVGVGNVRSGIVSESTGGALTLQASIARADGDRTRRTPVYVHSAPDRYLYCPVCPTGGATLTWFRDHFGEPKTGLLMAAGQEPGQEPDQEPDQEPAQDPYDVLTGLAAAVQPGAEGLIMLPHLSGAFSPEYEPLARGVWFGFTLAHGKGHFVRSILEAVAYMLRRNVELLADAGAVAGEIRSHGGGARSRLWSQIKADVCGVPVTTLQGEDAAIRGDAMLAGVAVGAFADLDEACEAMVRDHERFLPDARTAPIYEAGYRRYVELFEALRPAFASFGTSRD